MLELWEAKIHFQMSRFRKLWNQQLNLPSAEREIYGGLSQLDPPHLLTTSPGPNPAPSAAYEKLETWQTSCRNKGKIALRKKIILSCGPSSSWNRNNSQQTCKRLKWYRLCARIKAMLLKIPRAVWHLSQHRSSGRTTGRARLVLIAEQKHVWSKDSMRKLLLDSLEVTKPPVSQICESKMGWWGKLKTLSLPMDHGFVVFSSFPFFHPFTYPSIHSSHSESGSETECFAWHQIKAPPSLFELISDSGMIS